MKNTILLCNQATKKPFQYQVIRSSRKTISLQLQEDGDLLVRVPHHLPLWQIESLIRQKEQWILSKDSERLRQLERVRTNPSGVSSPTLSDTQRNALESRYRIAAASYFPKRVAYYQTLTGGSYTRITIRDQKTRWGSCSSRGTLSFNWRLMLAPPAVLDYVVLHELCHLTHMNHSKEFWNSIASIMPDYKVHRTWLKEHGRELTLS